MTTTAKMPKVEESPHVLFNTSMSETLTPLSAVLHHETVMEDPAILRILAKAREIEQLINTVGNTTPTERDELMDELHKLWLELGYQGTEAEATGWMSFPEDTLEEDDDESDGPSPGMTQIIQASRPSEQITNYYYSAEIMACGFCLVPDHITIDDENVAEQWRVHYEILMDHPDKPGVYMSGTADPARVRLDFAFPSAEHARNRLTYYHPEIIDEIDTRVLNCESAEEAVAALKGFVIYADDSNPHEAMLLSDARIYLNSIIEFDRELPYEICIQGKGVVIKEEANIGVAVMEPLASLASPETIRFVTFMKTPDPKTDKKLFFPSVDLYMHGECDDIPADRLAVPSRAFRNFSSVRSTYFNI